MELIKYPSKVLRKVSKELEFPLSDEDKGQMKELLEFTTNEYPTAQGMSAIQVGIDKRFFIVRIRGKEEIIINPTIVWKFGLQTSKESCFSVDISKTKFVYYKVNRPLLGVVKYYDLDGNKKTKFLGKKVVRVYCHEIDHLDGMTIDRIGVRFLEVDKQIDE